MKPSRAAGSRVLLARSHTLHSAIAVVCPVLQLSTARAERAAAISALDTIRARAAAQDDEINAVGDENDRLAAEVAARQASLDALAAETDALRKEWAQVGLIDMISMHSTPTVWR